LQTLAIAQTVHYFFSIGRHKFAVVIAQPPVGAKLDRSRLRGACSVEVGLAESDRRKLADAVDAQSGSLHQVDDITALALARAADGADLAAAA